MADEPETTTDSQETQEVTASVAVTALPFWKKIPKKVLLASIISIGLIILLISSWLVFKHFFDHKVDEVHKNTTDDDEIVKEITPESNFFVSIPEIVVNLRSLKAKGNVLRATFSLQIYSREDENIIKDYQPIIIDQILSYLRDQSIADLEGAGLERMRQALLTRVNNVIKPLKAHRVIIKDFIIQ